MIGNVGQSCKRSVAMASRCVGAYPFGGSILWRSQRKAFRRVVLTDTGSMAVLDASVLCRQSRKIAIESMVATFVGIAIHVEIEGRII